MTTCNGVSSFSIVEYIGTKAVKKAINAIAKGTLKSEGKSWYMELSDKGIHNWFVVFILFYVHSQKCENPFLLLNRELWCKLGETEEESSKYSKSLQGTGKGLSNNSVSWL